MKIYIVEDQIISLDDTIITISNLGHNCVGHSGDPFEALGQIESLLPDVVLMDIHLNGKQQGIQLAKKIKSTFNIPIIFTSSDITKAIIAEAADINPTAYIVKPVTEKDLLSALILAEKKTNDTLETPNNSSTQLFIKVKNKLEKVTLDTILFAYTDTKNYCTILTDSNKKYTVRSSIVGLQQLLKHEQFIQTHRSYIVNWTKVEAFYEGTQSIEIQGHSIPLGRTYKDAVYKRLKVL